MLLGDRGRSLQDAFQASASGDHLAVNVDRSNPLHLHLSIWKSPLEAVPDRRPHPAASIRVQQEHPVRPLENTRRVLGDRYFAKETPRAQRRTFPPAKIGEAIERVVVARHAKALGYDTAVPHPSHA